MLVNEKGVDLLSHKNNSNKTPLTVALIFGNTKAYSYLVQKGGEALINNEPQDPIRWPPRHKAHIYEALPDKPAEEELEASERQPEVTVSTDAVVACVEGNETLNNQHKTAQNPKNRGAGGWGHGGNKTPKNNQKKGSAKGKGKMQGSQAAPNAPVRNEPLEDIDANGASARIGEEEVNLGQNGAGGEERTVEEMELIEVK